MLMKILIIEDDISIRNVLRVGLESKSHSIDTAENGEEGSYLARTNEYDVILLDNVLPKKQGAQVCKEIRTAGIYTPILMLSVKSEIMEKVDLLNTGVDDYMTKPFSFEELVARINTLSRRGGKIEEKILTIGKIEIDRTRQIVKRNGREIYLTRKEYSILEYLSKNKNSIISRTQISEHVWNMDLDPFSNTLETHILNLRKKLKDTSKSIIQSIPGRGYRLKTG